MKVAAYEGIVENGRVRLLDNVPLPEKSRVYVVVPDKDELPVMHIRSPRLANPQQAVEFQKTVMIEDVDARL